MDRAPSDNGFNVLLGAVVFLTHVPDQSLFFGDAAPAFVALISAVHTEAVQVREWSAEQRWRSWFFWSMSVAPIHGSCGVERIKRLFKCMLDVSCAGLAVHFAKVVLGAAWTRHSAPTRNAYYCTRDRLNGEQSKLVLLLLQVFGAWRDLSVEGGHTLA